MDGMIIVGPQWGNTGSAKPLSGGVSGALRTQLAHGWRFDQTFNGERYLLDSDAITLASANTTKGALGTIKFVNGFFNPAGSRRLAVIDRATITTVSGTPAGGFFWNYITDVVVNSAATGAPRCTFLSSPTGSAGSAMLPQVNVVVTVLGALTTALTQLGAIGGPAAIAAGAGVYQVVDEIQGGIIVPPGCLLGIAATGAGTTHIVQSSLMWEEIPLLY